MKKSIYTLVVATFVAATIFTSCQSPAKKADNAKSDVQDARQDLQEAKKEANAEEQKAASAEEWKTFKSEAEVKIRDNETRIAELKVKLKKPGKILDPIYEKRINTLEQKNKDLQTKMDDYEKSQSDWESFKREFNHDMDELGQAIKDIVVDNKN